MVQNNSFILEKQKQISFGDRPVPQIKDPYDVLIEVKWTGICGSDIHYWQHGKIGQFVLTEPMVLGHESAGIVAEVGDAVKGLKKGDKIAMEPGIPCRRCVRCKEGKYNLCPEMAFAATPPYDGTLAKYYLLPEDFCHKLPENVSLEEGALMEPLGVAVHVLKQSHIKPGDSVVVFGAGPVGLLCMAVAKSLGARTVVAVDINGQRLEFAKEFAATGSFEPSRESKPTENAQKIRDENGIPDGADVAIEASGAEPSIQTAIAVLRSGGSFVQAGMGKEDINFPISAATIKELKISGSFRYGAGDYALAIELVRKGQIDVKKLITGKVNFEDAEKAFEDIRDAKGIKILIKGPE